MKKLLAIMIILTLGILITNAYSRTITVGHGDGYDYQTITEAARAAQPADVILVADGTYSESTGEAFPIDLGSSIILKRAVLASLPVIRGMVRIDGEGVRLDGLKITESSGRGISIANNSKVELNKCVIIGNPGGGVYGGPYNCGWGEPTSPLVCFDFNNGPQGWSFAGRIASFNEPNNTWDTGRLGLSPEGSANCFSYWGSPEIILKKDKVYRASWQVSSSVNVADDAVDFRLRANQLGNWRYWTTGVTSLNDAAPTTQTKTYDLIILPEMESTTDSIVLSFDLMGFDPANDLQSWLYLDQVSMDEVSIAPIVPAVIHAHYSFENYTEGWKFQVKIGDFNEPVPIVLPGRIGLSSNGSPYCFSYWLSPEIQVRKDRVYLVSWQVSSSTTDPDRVVDFRLRCNQSSNLRAWVTGTYFSTGAAYPAGGVPRTYQLMILPQMSTESDTIRLAFDIMSLDGANDLYSYIFLEEVTMVEYLIQP